MSDATSASTTATPTTTLGPTTGTTALDGTTDTASTDGSTGIASTTTTGDDGTSTGTDGSSGSTTAPVPVCGDGMVDRGEACDDGNLVDEDACTAACALAVCGDSIVRDRVEACDDGNDQDDDDCTNACALPTCGDGVKQPGEACDLGAQNSNTGACTLACLAPVCGDGFVQPSAGEQCDDGNGVDTDACPGTCAPAVCGDGFVHAGGEECDDANAVNSDACTFGCKAAKCGDGHVQVGVEQCDAPGESASCDLDCTPVACGDGVVNVAAGEACDDGDQVAGDGCEPDCQLTLRVANGDHNTCVVLAGGTLRCWGRGTSGALGNGMAANLGDEPGELPVADIDVGGQVVAVAVGREFTCALLDTGAVRCFGRGDRLGYGNTDNLGDAPGEMPTPDVDVGAIVVQLSAFDNHVCARTQSGGVRCWGAGQYGKLGYGDQNNRGDGPGEMPPPDVPLGGKAVHVAAGGNHTCAVLESGAVKCWGLGILLGQGNSNSLGDGPGEMPPPDVPLGGPAVTVTAGNGHTCAIMQTGKVRCWGHGDYGKLGYGNAQSVGDNPGEMPPADVATGGLVKAIELSNEETCALLANGKVKCWGGGIGADPNQMPPPDLKIGGNVAPVVGLIASGYYHHCAVFPDETLHCWGINAWGNLGYGNAMFTAPQQAGPVPY